ncbi:MAG: MarR family transcriptional regulator [Streptococcaceae bacterium]|jgi:MarR family transcriptional repressor of mepA|nr:MarR family transcriptional regulator [Streptococcaceae bacterium]
MTNINQKELSTLLQKVTKNLFFAHHKQMEELGLQKTQPHIIHILAKNDGQTQVELAQRLEVTPATISAMLKRMERDEMVYRVRSKEDARVTHVYLSDKGKENVDKIKDIFEMMQEKTFQDFTQEEMQQAQHIFKKIIENLGK